MISDDLAAAAMRVLPPEERARRFIRAGGDLLIVGDARLATPMADAIKREASDNPAFEKRVTNSAARVVAMKQRRGAARGMPCLIARSARCDVRWRRLRPARKACPHLLLQTARDPLPDFSQPKTACF